MYNIASPELPKEVMKKITSILHAYLWAGCDEVTGGKFKNNWDVICRPTKLGGLGILHLEIFASALSLLWLSQEWVDHIMSWIGLGNPCNDFHG
jgi:hypothetical protein